MFIFGGPAAWKLLVKEPGKILRTVWVALAGRFRPLFGPHLLVLESPYDNALFEHLPICEYKGRTVDKRAASLPGVDFRAVARPPNAIMRVRNGICALALGDDVRHLIEVHAVDDYWGRVREDELPAAFVVEPVLGCLGGDGLWVGHKPALADPLAVALDGGMRSTRVLLAFAERVLDVDHGEPPDEAGREAWDATGRDAETREVGVLGAVKVPERVELVSAHRLAEHLAEAFERARTEGDPFVFGEVEMRGHIQVEQQPRSEARGEGGQMSVPVMEASWNRQVD